MYYIAKLFQAGGLVIVLAGFLIKFPHLISPRILFVGLGFFVSGWITQRYMLNK
jgi:hypothetical protein